MHIKSLSVIAFSCLGLIIWINFLDFKFQELIPGKGTKFENLIEAFARSFLAAYIFYFLNVYLRERREKKQILPIVANNVIGILVNNYSIIQCLKKESNLKLGDLPSRDDFKELLSKIKPTENLPFYYKNENWLYLFENRRISTLSTINKIFQSGKHVDDRLRRILLQMQSSLYLREDYAFNSKNFNEEDLIKYHLVFWKYFDLIKQLHDHYSKDLKKYFDVESRA